MRIIAGKYKSRKLVFKKSTLLRPTQDRVKETVFNIMSDKLENSICLDLFAGCGSLGFEAVSRGAIKVDLVDVNVEFLYKNLERINNDKIATIFKTNALRYIKNTDQSYDVIFLDPPWTKSDLFELSLNAIFEFDILKPKGIIVCEHPKEYEKFYSFNVKTQKKFGNKKISILEKLNEKCIIPG
jgi:16S rRNA (guanine966-N2)-methyltransferase